MCYEEISILLVLQRFQNTVRLKCGVTACAKECSTASHNYRPYCMVALNLIILSSATNFRYY